MATTTAPTADDHTSARVSEALYVTPDRRRAIEELEDLAPDMNGVFIADMLSAFLTHERCGLALYRSVATRSNNPMLQQTYESFGSETEEHVRILEDAIARLGGQPGYISPAARAVRAMGDSTLQSTFLVGGTLDVMTTEMVMLDAVLMAESIDHENWQGVATMIDTASDDAVHDALQQAYDQVAPEENEHLEWARSTRLKMTKLQASSAAMATVGATAEEMVESVRGWFSQDGG